LLEAYQEVVRVTKLPPAAKIAAPVRRPFWMAMGLTIAGLTALLVFQPAWFFNRPPAEPPQLQEASLRIRMYVEIQKLQRYRTEKGRWPATLLESAGDSTGLTYRRLGDSYLLSGSNGHLQLDYKPESSAEAFLGNSYRLVRERTR
jgi:hypothetical protein